MSNHACPMCSQGMSIRKVRNVVYLVCFHCELIVVQGSNLYELAKEQRLKLKTGEVDMAIGGVFGQAVLKEFETSLPSDRQEFYDQELSMRNEVFFKNILKRRVKTGNISVIIAYFPIEHFGGKMPLSLIKQLELIIKPKIPFDVIWALLYRKAFGLCFFTNNTAQIKQIWMDIREEIKDSSLLYKNNKQIKNFQFKTVKVLLNLDAEKINLLLQRL